MSALAAEEAVHLRRMAVALASRDAHPARRRAKPWVQSLRNHMETDREPLLKVDRLLVAALNEVNLRSSPCLQRDLGLFSSSKRVHNTCLQDSCMLALWSDANSLANCAECFLKKLQISAAASPPPPLPH